jgi:hypothetical protein
MEVKDALQSPAALDAMVSLWRAGTLPGKAFTHEAHILVGAWHLTHMPYADALSAMREGIPRFNVAAGGVNTEDSGYHETLTVFWVKLMARYLGTLPGEQTPMEKVQAAVGHFGARRDWFKDYYSFDVAKSREARARWVEPDLQPLD